MYGPPPTACAAGVSVVLATIKRTTTPALFAHAPKMISLR